MIRKRFFFIAFAMSCLSVHLNAQVIVGWATFGSTLGARISQDDVTYSSGFGPEIELGVCNYSKTVGLGISGNLRWIDTKKIEWFDDTKFIWDIYAGPVFMFPFSHFDEALSAVKISPQIGYSTSAAWFDPDVKSGSFSLKLTVDVMIHGFTIGAWYRPLKQHIESKSSSSKYGEYMKFGEFEASPSFGIRLGYAFWEDL